MTNQSNSQSAVKRQPSRMGSGVGLVLSLVLLVLPGIAALGFAETHKPTVENLFANGGDVLTPSAYQGVHALALLMLIGGGVLAVVCIARMASRRTSTSVPLYAAPPAHLRAPAPPISAGPQLPPPAPETRQASPVA
jgi:hypothetical protein